MNKEKIKMTTIKQRIKQLFTPSWTKDFNEREQHAFDSLKEQLQNGDVRLVDTFLGGGYIQRTDKGNEKLTRYILREHCNRSDVPPPEDVDKEWEQGYNQRYDKNDVPCSQLSVEDLMYQLSFVPSDYEVWIEYPERYGLKQPPEIQTIGHMTNDEADIIDASFSMITDHENQRVVIRHHY